MSCTSILTLLFAFSTSLATLTLGGLDNQLLGVQQSDQEAREGIGPEKSKQEQRKKHVWA